MQANKLMVDTLGALLLLIPIVALRNAVLTKLQIIYFFFHFSIEPEAPEPGEPPRSVQA